MNGDKVLKKYKMRFSTLPLVMTVLLMVTACSKDDKQPIAEPGSCRVSATVNQNTVNRYHYYADSSLQSQVIVALKDGVVLLVDSMVYDYKSDTVTVKTFEAGSVIRTVWYPLHANGLATMQISKTTGGQITDTVFYSYNADGYKITEFQRTYSTSVNGPVLLSTININYTTANGNTTGYTRVSTLARSGSVSRVTVAYDFYRDKIAILQLLGKEYFSGKRDANLLKKHTVDSNGNITETAFTYRFNSNGLPEQSNSVTTNTTGSTSGESQIFYQCQ